MKKYFFVLTVLALCFFSSQTVQAQQLDELAAPGKKVYVELIDVKGDLEDAEGELKDLKTLTGEEMNWVVVDTKGEADFVLQIEESRKKVMGFPQTTLKPAILTPDGDKVWEGKQVKVGANEFNAFRSTYGAYWAMVKTFKKEKALKPAVKDN
jgi:hypothetical protein